MGYNFGDGNIYFERKRKKGHVSFYGAEEDLRKIKQDISHIGFKCAGPYSRTRDHEIKTAYDIVRFTAEHWNCNANSNSLAALLVTLGTPLGNKTKKPFRVPGWIMRAPLWQKRLFLAGFFGAEMSSPKTMKGFQNRVMPRPES